MVSSDRTRGIWHKVKQRSLFYHKQCFTVRVSEDWHRMPKEVLESPFLEALKSHLDTV